MGESVALRMIERDPKRKGGRDSVVDDEGGCWNGDRASDKRHEAKQLETKTLAGKHASQCKRHE